MAFIFKGYIRLLQRHTLPTQMATAAVTSGSGDLLWQMGFEGKSLDQVEWVKTGRLAVYGAFCWAPLSNRWHRVLASINLNGRVKTTLARTLTDLAIFSPFATCLFYSVQGTFEGRPFRTPAVAADGGEPPQGIYERLEERLWPTVQKQWLLFGPANIVNLSVIPIYARPPFMNVFSLVWNVYLASAQAQGEIPVGTKVTDRDMAVAAVEVME
ncbi:hypothetical protein JCM8097_003984 [Rhodosporidiobolus ruineniae]